MQAVIEHFGNGINPGFALRNATFLTLFDVIGEAGAKTFGKMCVRATKLVVLDTELILQCPLCKLNGGRRSSALRQLS